MKEGASITIASTAERTKAGTASYSSIANRMHTIHKASKSRAEQRLASSSLALRNIQQVSQTGETQPTMKDSAASTSDILRRLLSSSGEPETMSANAFSASGSECGHVELIVPIYKVPIMDQKYVRKARLGLRRQPQQRQQFLVPVICTPFNQSHVLSSLLKLSQYYVV